MSEGKVTPWAYYQCQSTVTKMVRNFNISEKCVIWQSLCSSLCPCRWCATDHLTKTTRNCFTWITELYPNTNYMICAFITFKLPIKIIKKEHFMCSINDSSKPPFTDIMGKWPRNSLFFQFNKFSLYYSHSCVYLHYTNMAQWVLY